MPCGDSYFSPNRFPNHCNNDSQWTGLALRIFLTAHRFLTSFAYILKLRLPKCHTNCENIPLYGALNVTRAALASMTRSEFSKLQLQRPGLFYDMFPCALCPIIGSIPENLVLKVESVLSCLRGTSSLEDLSNKLESALHLIENVPDYFSSQELQLLFVILTEITKSLYGVEQTSPRSLDESQTSIVLNFTKTFINDWSEKKSQQHPSQRICTFCNKMTSRTRSQWGVLCCKEAENFRYILKEWITQQYLTDDDTTIVSEGIDTICTSGKQYTQIYRRPEDLSRFDFEEERLSFCEIFGGKRYREERSDAVGETARSTEEKKTSEWIDEVAGKVPRELDRATIKYPSTRGTSARHRVQTEVSSSETELQKGKLTHCTANGEENKFDGSRDKNFTDKGSYPAYKSTGKDQIEVVSRPLYRQPKDDTSVGLILDRADPSRGDKRNEITELMGKDAVRRISPPRDPPITNELRKNILTSQDKDPKARNLKIDENQGRDWEKYRDVKRSRDAAQEMKITAENVKKTDFKIKTDTGSSKKPQLGIEESEGLNFSIRTRKHKKVDDSNEKSVKELYRAKPRIEKKVELPVKSGEKPELLAKSEKKTELPAKSEKKTELPAKSEKKTELPAKSEKNIELLTKSETKGEPPTKAAKKAEPLTKTEKKAEPSTKTEKKAEALTKSEKQTETFADNKIDKKAGVDSKLDKGSARKQQNLDVSSTEKNNKNTEFEQDSKSIPKGSAKAKTAIGTTETGTREKPSEKEKHRTEKEVIKTEQDSTRKAKREENKSGNVYSNRAENVKIDENDGNIGKKELSETGEKRRKMESNPTAKKEADGNARAENEEKRNTDTTRGKEKATPVNTTNQKIFDTQDTERTNIKTKKQKEIHTNINENINYPADEKTVSLNHKKAEEKEISYLQDNGTSGEKSKVKETKDKTAKELVSKEEDKKLSANNDSKLKKDKEGRSKISPSNELTYMEEKEKLDGPPVRNLQGDSGRKTNLSYEKSAGKSRDTDDEEKLRHQEGGKTVGEEKIADEEEMSVLSKNKETHGERRKKADAVDSERRGVSYTTDEEGKVLKGDGKRKGHSSGVKQGTDEPSLINSRKTEEHHGNTDDKSALNSNGGKKKEEITATKKESRLPDSSRMTGDDYSKINGFRSQKGKREDSKPSDDKIGSRKPIEYQLSNEYFVRLGWTVLPVTKTMRKIVQYRARTSKPHLDWFRNRKANDATYYEDGVTLFLKFHPDGAAEVFYPNGRLAIKVYKPRDREYDMYTVFTPGGKDSLGIERQSQVLAVFDSNGNGTVFNEDGKTRLSYNQIGGIYSDNPSGLPYAWLWKREAKKPIIQTICADNPIIRLEKSLDTAYENPARSSGSQKTAMSRTSSRNKEKKVAEQKQKPVVEDREDEVESGSDFLEAYPEKNCHIRTICLKLNEHLSLRILDRANINLRFSAHTKNVKIHLGTVLNYNKEVASYFVNSNEVYNMQQNKFENLLSKRFGSESSLQELSGEMRNIKKCAENRSRYLSKYKPFAERFRKKPQCCISC